MLTWIALTGLLVVLLVIAIVGLMALRRRLILHTQTLTPYTEQHGRALERRLDKLVRESHEQTSTLQDSLEALRRGRKS